VAFPSGPKSAYTSFIVQNVDSNAIVDNVWIQIGAGAANASFNHIATADITEMNANGYLPRTLYVPGTGNLPKYTTIALAAAAARDGDRISVASGNYASDAVIVDAAVTFIGDDFTVASLTIDSDVTFEQSVTANIITVNADVILAGNLTAEGAAGELTVNNPATITGNSGTAITIGELTMFAGATINVTSGTLEESTANFSMGGTFTVDGGDWAGWGGSGIVAQALPFSDDFEGYTNNSVISEYGLYGWGASDSSVVVQSVAAYSGKALYLPDGTAASNNVVSAESAIWTEYFIRPAQGAEPSSTDATGKSFMSYVNTNGHMVVYDGSDWIECDLNIAGVEPALLSSNEFKRVVIYQDFGSSKFALFIDRGVNSSLELVAQKISFPGTQASMNSFVINNSDNKAYLDNVRIRTTRPEGFANLDGDEMDDGEEISTYGSTFIFPAGIGTIFKFI